MTAQYVPSHNDIPAADWSVGQVPLSLDGCFLEVGLTDRGQGAKRGLARVDHGRATDGLVRVFVNVKRFAMQADGYEQAVWVREPHLLNSEEVAGWNSWALSLGRLPFDEALAALKAKIGGAQ